MDISNPIVEAEWKAPYNLTQCFGRFKRDPSDDFIVMPSSMETQGKSNIGIYLVKRRMHILNNMPTCVRYVSAKRARKLRRLGESVYWSIPHQSLVWEMKVGLADWQRDACRKFKRGHFYMSDQLRIDY